jgi:hypothetical protein
MVLQTHSRELVRLFLKSLFGTFVQHRRLGCNSALMQGASNEIEIRGVRDTHPSLPGDR